MSQRDGDPRIGIAMEGWSAGADRLRSDAHQVLDPFDLSGFQENAPLPARTALVIVDRDLLAADHEQPPIGPAEPVIQGYGRDTQVARSLLSG